MIKSLSKTPFFSVIIVSLNAGESITETVNSILSQSFSDYEIIIKDGNSVDETINLIPDNSKIKLFIESDFSIYDAMNQAIAYSSGKYIIFMNCGDLFYDTKVLDTVYSNVKNNDNETEDSSKVQIIYTNYVIDDIFHKLPKKLYDFYLFRTPLNHQSMFFQREVFDKYGKFDTTYLIAADYEYTLKVYRSSIVFTYCDCITCNYLGNGVSETKKGIKIKNKEFIYIRKKYFSKIQFIKYQIILFFSFKKIRFWISSHKSPKLLRRIYRYLVNLNNKL